MAILLDKLKNRGVQRMGGATEPTISANPNMPAPPSPLPTINQQIQQPTARSLASRVGGIPQKGAVGSQPQFANIKGRMVADLPANVQLQGIQKVLAGQSTGNQIIDNFVKGMAAQGKSPEEIRQAFIAQQKASASPLVLM